MRSSWCYLLQHRVKLQNPCHSTVFAEVFWLKPFLDTFAQDQSFVCWGTGTSTVSCEQGSWWHCTPFPWLCSRKGAWMNLLSFCGSIPLLQPRCHFFLLSQAGLGRARCQGNLQLALHRARIQPLWVFLGWYMVLFLSLSERVQATELDRVLFLTGTATDKRISQLKSLF